MGLEETYPGVADSITAARGAGYADPEIHDYIRGQIQQATKAGHKPEEVSSYLSTPKGNALTRAAGDYWNSLKQNAMATGKPELSASIPDNLDKVTTPLLQTADQYWSQKFPKATATLNSVLESLTPDIQGAAESIRQVPQESRRLSDVLSPVLGRPVSEGVAPYIAGARAAVSAPFALLPKVVNQTLSPALRTISEGAGKLSELVGLPKPITDLVKEFSPDAVMIALPVAFNATFNRPPTGRADIIKAVREKPAFVENLKEQLAQAKLPDERPFELGAEKPTATTAPGSTIGEPAGPQARPVPETQAAAEPLTPRGEIAVPERFTQTPETQARVQAKLDEMRQKPLGQTDQQAVKAAADEHIRNLIETPADIEYNGHTYTGAVREGNNIRLKDTPDKVVRGVNEILKVEEKIPFDVPAEEPAPDIAMTKEAAKPIFQQTEAGAQSVIPGAEGRTIPNTPLRPKRAQTETPMDLEQPGIRAKEPGLFEKPTPTPEANLSAEEIAARDEMRGMLGGKRYGFPEQPKAETEGFPEFRAKPKDVPQSINPLERKYQPPGPAGEQPIVRRGDIIRDMQDAFQVPIRSGHGNFAQMKASGFFKVKEEVIRLKKANDMEVVAHEIGHFISKKFLNYEHSKAKGRRSPFAGELSQLGRDLYGNRKPHGGYAEEGVAEFIRFYVVDPAKAEAKAPGFYKFFENLVDTKFPDVRDTLQKARDDWTRYREQPAVARVLSQISIGEKQPKTFTLSGLYTKAFDDLNPINVFTKRMTEGQAPLRVSDNPYTLARLFRGWIAKADLFLTKGPRDYDTLQWNGMQPLNDILSPFDRAGKLDDLRAYLAARSAADRIKLGQETGFAHSDVAETLRIYNDKPEFVKAAEAIGHYQDSLLDYASKRANPEDAFFSIEQIAAMKASHPHHVSFYRVKEAWGKGSDVAGSQTFANVGSPIKRAKGSALEIVDPLESLVKDTYLMINAVDRNAVGQTMVKLANSREGMGKFVEKVPRDKIPLTIKDFELDNLLRRYGKIKETTAFKTSKTEFTKETGIGGEGATPTSKPAALIENRVKEALTARGFSEGEAKLYIERLKSAKTDTAVNAVIEKIITEQTVKTITKEFQLDVPPEVVAAFRPDPKIPGMDNIMSVRFNGKSELYQVHPDLYEAMAGLDRQQTTALVKILSLPARALRLGATTLSPEFAVRNPVRDQWTAMIFSAFGHRGPIDFTRGLMHVIKGDELYQAWQAGGGAGAAMVSLDRGSLQKTLAQVIKSGEAKSIAHTIIRHPIDSLRALSELGEAATRVGEFARAIDKQGVGLTKESILQGAFASKEVTLDFQRMGSAIKANNLNQLVAFLNANLQSWDKMARAFKADPMRVTAKAVATITLPSLALYAVNHDDPQYTELPRWQRDLFWIIPSKHVDSATWKKMTSKEKADWSKEHTVWRIPKPFEMGIIFGTFPERVMDWTLKNDPEAIKEFTKSLMSSAPLPLPTFAVPLIENFANFSFFRDRKIVPRSKEELAPSEQYGSYTSEVAKSTGKLIGYSPAKIENLLQGWFGAAGRLGLDVASAPYPNKTERPEKSMADVPVVRAMVARFPGQPESIERFYDKFTKAQEAQNTFSYLVKQRRVEEARQYLKDNAEAIHDEKRLSPLAKTVALLRKRENVVRESKLSPEDKRRELDAITFRMTDIARIGLKNRSNANDQPQEESFQKTGTGD